MKCPSCLNECTVQDRKQCRYCGTKLERESAAGTVSPADSIAQGLESKRCGESKPLPYCGCDGESVCSRHEPHTFKGLANDGSHAPHTDACVQCGLARAAHKPFTNVPIAPEAPTPESLAKIVAAVLDMPRTEQAAFLTKVDDYAGAHYTGSKEQVISEVTTLIYDAEMFQDSLEPVRESTPATVPSADQTPEKQFRIYYKHLDCPVDPEIEWEDTWSCAVNGECPACHTKDIEPVDWEDVLNTDEDDTPSASEEQERWR